MNSRIKNVENLSLHKRLGVGHIESADGKGRFTIPVTDEVLNPAGVLHGGVIYVLCDVCAYAGLLSILDDQIEAVTHDFHISIMRSVPHGAEVTFSSEIIKMGRRLCFIAVTVSMEGSTIATAKVTKSLIQQ